MSKKQKILIVCFSLGSFAIGTLCVIAIYQAWIWN